MTRKDFNDAIEHIRSVSLDTLNKKNGNYSDSTDALHNFNAGADIAGGTAAQAAWGYMTKQTLKKSVRTSSTILQSFMPLALKSATDTWSASMNDTLYAHIKTMPYYRRLTIAMLIADITPKELAYELRASRETIYGFCNGYRLPNNKRRAELASLIGRELPILKKLLMEE